MSAEEIHTELIRLKEEGSALKEQMYSIKDGEITIDPKKHLEFLKLINQQMQLLRIIRK